MRALWFFLALLALVSPARSEPLDVPTGSIILTVTGNITEHNAGESAVFDRESLSALGEVSFTTTTIWNQGKKTFTGVPLLRLLERLGATGSMLEARALNDYRVKIPVSDAVEGGPILAYEMDGKIMSVRDKGPIWVVYPYDEDAEYRTETTYARSIWQLSGIEVLD